MQEIGRIYKSVVRELKLEEALGNKQLEGSHPHSYMRRFMSQLSMTPKEYLWGEALALALLPQVPPAPRQPACSPLLLPACPTTPALAPPLLLSAPCPALPAAGGPRCQRAHALARQEPHLHRRHRGLHHRQPARQDVGAAAGHLPHLRRG